MFAKFQTSSQKKIAAPETQLSIQMKYEKALYDIETQREKLNEYAEQVELKVQKLDQEIRELIQQGRKVQARGRISEMKTLQKQIEKNHVKYNLLTQMKIQIETLDQDTGIANLMEEVGKLALDSQPVNDILSDGLVNWKEFQQSQAESDELFKKMAESSVNTEEIEESFAQYELEAQQEYNEKAAKDFAKVPQVKIPQIQKQSVHLVPSVQPKVSQLLE